MFWSACCSKHWLWCSSTKTGCCELALIINVAPFPWTCRLLQDWSRQLCCVFYPQETQNKQGIKLHFDVRSFQRQMVAIFSRVFIGWTERWLWLTEAPRLVAFMRKTKRIGKNRRREAGREIDFSATISDPLNCIYPFHSWSTSPHTPASLRDISCAQRGDKTHSLSASVGSCIHLVPMAAPWMKLSKWLFVGRRSLLFSLCGASSHSKVKGKAMTEGEKRRLFCQV